MLYGHNHHESLSLTDSTLYYCQAPLFNNYSTVFTVINGTHLEVKDVICDFTTLLEETTDTTCTTTLITLSTVFAIAYLIKKKR